MEITSLPTESLYKFMAFSGLVIIFGTAAYAYKFLTAIGKQMIEVKTETEIWSIKSAKYQKQTEREVDLLAAKTISMVSPQIESIKRVLEEPDNPLQPSAFKDEMKDLAALRSEVHDRWKSFDNDSLELGILLVQLQGKHKLFEYDNAQKKLLQIGCIIAVFIGLLLSTYGFHRWSIIQDYNDRVLIKEAIDKLK